MDVRIGNDIKVVIPISEFTDVLATNIKFANCTFINTSNDCMCKNDYHPSHDSTEYTIRSCDNPQYYTYPCNIHRCCINQDPHCGFVVYDYSKYPHAFKTCCRVEGDYLVCYFPADCQRRLGTYKCILQVRTVDQDWGWDNIHTYSSSYEDVFTLKNTGEQYDPVVIDLSEIETPVD